MYKKEYVQTFLEKQGQLFDEPVADDFEEAEAFLEDCMAVVLDSLKDVKKYLDGMGADVEGLSLKELEEEIMSYINTLPPQCHKIFMLSRSYGLKNREIAEQLNISIKAVEKQISKALSGLKEYLIQRDLFPLLVLAVTCLSL